MIPKFSKKRAVENKKYSEIRLEFLEAHPKCEVCKFRDATTIHHKKGRGIYLCVIEFFLAACMPCHEKIELNPKWAKEKGYSISRTA